MGEAVERRAEANLGVFVLQGKADGYFWEEKDAGSTPRLWVDENGNAFHAVKNIWRLATIGIGSSIAYYLNAMWQVSTRYGYSHERTLMLGRVDAWHESERGDGFINHEWHNIGHWSALGVAPYQRDYVERSQFAWENAFHIWRVCQEGGTHVSDVVTRIEKFGDIFRLHTRGGAVHLAAKVVCGIGAGPHYALPGERGPVGPEPKSALEVQAQYRTLADRVVDLDSFMRAYPRPEKPGTRKGKIIVHGTNAGIDAVQRAREWGFEVIFFGSKKEAAWLTGNRLSVSPVATRLPDASREGEEVEVIAIGRSRPRVVPTESGVRVTYTPEKGSETTVEVLVYVIALGQNADAEGGVGAVLRSGGLTPEQLEPIYDTNQIFGLPFQTVLGLQTKGASWARGLQIVGAAADALARTESWSSKIRHNYRDQYTLDTDSMSLPELAEHIDAQNRTRSLETQLTLDGAERARSLRAFRFKKAEAYLAEMKLADLMDHQIDPSKVPPLWMAEHETSTPDLSTPSRPAATAISSVLGSAQLGAVRATMAAMHAMIPDYMLGSDSQANFTSDDRTMLAVYIAKNFPSIDPTRANSLVEEIVGARRTSLGKTATFTGGSVPSTDLGFDAEQTRQINALLENTNQIWKRIHG